MKIIKKDIYQAVENFRLAILDAKFNGEFSWRNRLSNFPGGCCDDACDLLAYYLQETYGISTKQGNGVYRDDDPNNTANHAWLVMENDIIVDITIDQFAQFRERPDEIYIGKANIFYKNIEDKKIYDNFDITKDARLWDSYNRIMKYMIDR